MPTRLLSLSVAGALTVPMAITFSAGGTTPPAGLVPVGAGVVPSGRGAAEVVVDIPTATPYAAAAVARSRATGDHVSAQVAQPLGPGVRVVGVTWERAAAGVVIPEYRVQHAGGWSAWRAFSLEDGRGADGTAEGARSRRAGSAPTVFTDATAVVVRLRTPAGGAPARPQLTVIDPGVQAVDARAQGESPSGGAAEAQISAGGGVRPARESAPPVHSRAEWGADESMRPAAPAYASVKGISIHHTDGSNAYTRSQVPAILRGIHRYHVKSRGWNDIGYNFLVDRFGGMWEGRYGGMTRAVSGAHTLGHNAYLAGISVMGTFDSGPPPTKALESVARLVAWKSALHELSPTGLVNLYGKTRASVSGHRNHTDTTCPGDALYAKLPWIRARAKDIMGYDAALTLPHDIDHQMGSDVLGHTADGRLLISSVLPDGSMSTPRTFGKRPFALHRQAVLPGDVNRDGAVDIVTLSKGGRLYLFPGDGNGGLGRPSVLARGLTDSTIAGVGDWNRDGWADLVSYDRSAGRIYLYPGSSSGLRRREVLMRGWLGIRDITGVGDRTGDGTVDLLVRQTDGATFIVAGDPLRGWRRTIAIGSDYARFASLTGVSDADGDRRPDVFALDQEGRGWLGLTRDIELGAEWRPVSTDFEGFTPYGG